MKILAEQAKAAESVLLLFCVSACCILLGPLCLPAAWTESVKALL